MHHQMYFAMEAIQAQHLLLQAAAHRDILMHGLHQAEQDLQQTIFLREIIPSP